MLHNDDAPAGGMWQQMFLNQWSVRIGGGTEQIQKNVLGERVLGLPSEPRPDKTAPLPRPPPQLAPQPLLGTLEHRTRAVQRAENGGASARGRRTPSR